MRNIIIENSDRFKSVFVGVNMLLPLDGLTNSKNALLAEVLKKSNSMFKSEKDLEIKLASLYNTTIEVDVEKLDNLYNVKFGMELLNIKYIDKETVGCAKDILLSLILSPNMPNGLFKEDVFNREKESLVEKINAEHDDKKKYALKELEKDMYEGTNYAVNLYGTVQDVKEITNEELSHHYNYVINNSQIIVTASGNLNGMEDLPQEIYNALCEKCGKREVINKKEVDGNAEFNKREENQDIAQSVLCIGLKATSATKDEMSSMLVYNSIMGGTPASKLFQNVREKESLAYFAKSMYNRFKNAIYMYAGVDPKNNKKAEEVMIKQVELLKNGEITEIEFKAAKQNLLSAYREMNDSKVAIIRNALNNEIYFGKEISMEECINQIEKVAIQDVINIANKMEITNVFLLGGASNV